MPSVRAARLPVNEYANTPNMTVMALEIGDTAPDFELPVRGKETVRLSEALKRGPVVLLTYILDFSPG